MKLYIGNKNYSSWSLRSWLLLRAAEIPFDEVMVRLDHHDPQQENRFRPRMLAVSPAGRVPTLVDDAGWVVWDTLAIAEYLAERFPERQLWPADAQARARARSLCAEMHAGFGALRTHCPMNIEFVAPELGPRILADHPAVAQDLARIVQMWTDALTHSGGPFLFGRFGIADAFFAPVAYRLRNYGLPVPEGITAYIDALRALPALQEWEAQALAEHDFLPEDEPYRSRR